MKNQIIAQVKEALAKTLNIPIEQIDTKAKLKSELGLDSMSSLTFVIALEDSISGFSVNPDTLNASSLETVDSVSDYIIHELIDKR